MPLPHSGGGGPSGTRGAAGRCVKRPWDRGVDSPTKHLDISQGALKGALQLLINRYG